MKNSKSSDNVLEKVFSKVGDGLKDVKKEFETSFEKINKKSSDELADELVNKANEYYTKYNEFIDDRKNNALNIRENELNKKEIRLKKIEEELNKRYSVLDLKEMQLYKIESALRTREKKLTFREKNFFTLYFVKKPLSWLKRFSTNSMIAVSFFMAILSLNLPWAKFLIFHISNINSLYFLLLFWVIPFLSVSGYSISAEKVILNNAINIFVSLFIIFIVSNKSIFLINVKTGIGLWLYFVSTIILYIGYKLRNKLEYI